MEHMNDQKLEIVTGGTAAQHVRYYIGDECVCCDICANECPFDAIHLDRSRQYPIYVIDPYICAECGVCKTICPVDAVQEI